MRSIQTTGIILNRINFGEADRILTVITPDNGKFSVIAKGVRKEKSKLAGGIELFSISNISFIRGKRDISTLVSTRLVTHYGEIVKDLDRTKLGFALLKAVDKSTEENCEAEYYEHLLTAFTLLNAKEVNLELLECWFYLRLLKLLGHEPNLRTDTMGGELIAGESYRFDQDNMAFFKHMDGQFSDKHIKAMRLLLRKDPSRLQKVSGLEEVGSQLNLLAKIMLAQFVQI